MITVACAIVFWSPHGIEWEGYVYMLGEAFSSVCLDTVVFHVVCFAFFRTRTNNS